MHRRKSWTLIAGVFLALILVETTALHIIVATRSQVIAWVLTATSLQLALLIVAQIRAVHRGGLRVTADAVELVVGLKWRATIPRAAIARAELSDTVPAGALNASLIQPTIVLALDRAVEVRGPFGIRRTPTTIAVTVDEPERFLAALSSS